MNRWKLPDTVAVSMATSLAWFTIPRFIGVRGVLDTKGDHCGSILRQQCSLLNKASPHLWFGGQARIDKKSQSTPNDFRLFRLVVGHAERIKVQRQIPWQWGRRKRLRCHRASCPRTLRHLARAQYISKYVKIYSPATPCCTVCYEEAPALAFATANAVNLRIVIGQARSLRRERKMTILPSRKDASRSNVCRTSASI